MSPLRLPVPPSRPSRNFTLQNLPTHLWIISIHLLITNLPIPRQQQSNGLLRNAGYLRPSKAQFAPPLLRVCHHDFHQSLTIPRRFNYGENAHSRSADLFQKEHRTTLLLLTPTLTLGTGDLGRMCDFPGLHRGCRVSRKSEIDAKRTHLQKTG